MAGPVATEQAVWDEQDTTPAAVEAALRKLLEQRHAEDEAFVPARVVNLICIVDRDWRGEIENRLENVGRFHPSRTILCSVERRRTAIDARVSMGSPDDGGGVHVGEEMVDLRIGEEHLPRLKTIIDPLIVPDLATVAWAPHGHDEAVDAVTGLAGVVMVDSAQATDAREAIARAQHLLDSAYVVDLAWLRSAPWRERIAATFDPLRWRESLREITSFTITHHPDSAVTGVMLAGWMASRLEWEPAVMEAEDNGLVARARTAGRKVKVRLEVDTTMPVPGLAGIAVETASGLKLSLFRGPGGLSAHRKLPGGKESSWVVVGASRGEAGILGEGIRQALLRDPTYGPALTAACGMLPS